MKDREVLKIGNIFPAMRLQNTNAPLVSINKNILGKTYTLVDFWFLACGPCRKQFPDFSRLFRTYASSGFQIVGVSTDTDSKFNLWKEFIATENLEGHQFIDKNGIVSEPMGILYFPTNFLLDSTGVILHKNIVINELEALLRQAAVQKK